MNRQQANSRALICGIFDDLRFPAARWEIVTHALDHGLGGRVLALLWELQPEGVASRDGLAEWLNKRMVRSG